MIALLLAATLTASQPSCTTIPKDVPSASVTPFQYGIRFLLAGDFDADGHQDLISTSSSSVSILYGRGDGTFDDEYIVPGSFPIPHYGNTAAADFDGDGDEDIVFTNSGTLQLHLNLGHRRFASAIQLHSAGPYDEISAVGDFTDDGRPDIVFFAQDDRNSANSRAILLVNDQNGKFTQRDTALKPNNQWHLASGDLDHDGHLDIVRAEQGVEIFSGDGTGHFSAPRTLFEKGPGDRYRPFILDLNHDGNDDLVVLQSGSRIPSEIAVFHGPLDFSRGSSPSFRFPTNYTWEMLPGDFDGDGGVDLAVYGLGPFEWSVIRNDGGGGLLASPAGTGLAVYPPIAATADFDGDGILDLASPAGSRAVSVFFGRGDGTFRQRRNKLPPGAFIIGTADFDDDGVDELIVQDSQVRVGWYASGAYVFEDVPGIARPGGGGSLSVPGNLRGDYAITVGDVHPSPGKELIAADGRFIRAFARDSGGRWSAVASRDVSSPILTLTAVNVYELDAFDEIAVVTRSGSIFSPPCQSSLSIVRLDQTTMFSMELPCNTFAAVHTADFDGDGHGDLLISGSGAWAQSGTFDRPGPLLVDFKGSVRYMRGHGDGKFDRPITLLSDSQIDDVSVGDLNGDAHPDIAVTRYLRDYWSRETFATLSEAIPKIDVLLGNGMGLFLPAPSPPPPYNAIGHVISDVNEDGIGDLVVNDDHLLTTFYGTARDGLIAGTMHATDGAPFAVRTPQSHTILYGIRTGLAGVIEHECP